MIDRVSWEIRICDLCRKDESELDQKLVGVMENGQWVGGFSREKARKSKEIRAEWEQEILRPCIVFRADMDEVVICEEHLKEILCKKDELIGS